MTIQTAITSGTMRKLPVKRIRIEDDLIADYLTAVVKPGDRTLQIGGSDLGTAFLQRGAFHEVIAPIAAIDALQADCERRGIKSDRLRGQAAATPSADRLPLDAALIGANLGFPSMAGNWRQIASRLKLGGVLVLMGTSQGSSARLADALMSDDGWSLQEMIAGDVAVFRKASVYDEAETQVRLSAAGDPRRPPRGLKPGLLAGVMRTLFGWRASNRGRLVARRTR
tara:strand:- start:9589 stop:10266 length:678 start_codon:yes stop_codon:yes gene_type:complete